MPLMTEPSIQNFHAHIYYDPDHRLAAGEQAQCAMHADEAGGAGDEDGHVAILGA